jgi:S-adenosylmethionine-diacylgycerolhomoserine-N-methlytransferase
MDLANPEKRRMSVFSELKMLYHLAVAPVRGDTHAARLENFYNRQAQGYDAFRRRLLHGRAELNRAIIPPPGATWLDIGGGTGENLEHLGDRLPLLQGLWVIDLSESLLQVASERIARHNWTNVHVLRADATSFAFPCPGGADVITFSYSLSMIPDWCAALEHARQLLKPGGIIGVVDFFVSHKHPAPDRRKHGWFTRTFWPTWFAADNVFLSPAPLDWLTRKFQTLRLQELQSRVPYLPLGKVPYFQFMGRKLG